MSDLHPEGNSWKLCLIGGHAMHDGRCFNCGAIEARRNELKANHG